MEGSKSYSLATQWMNVGPNSGTPYEHPGVEIDSQDFRQSSGELFLSMYLLLKVRSQRFYVSLW